MLEDPSYSDIVRWGDENDSFVVLEVLVLVRQVLDTTDNDCIVRKIHQNHPPKTLQTQQLCQFRPPAQQIRLSQSAPEQ